MDQLLRAFLAILLDNALLIPLVLSIAALFPRRVARTRAVADSLPGRAFAVGLINFLFFGALALGFSAFADALGLELIRLDSPARVARRRRPRNRPELRADRHGATDRRAAAPAR